MNHTEAGRYWNENAHAWTQLARAGNDEGESDAHRIS